MEAKTLIDGITQIITDLGSVSTFFWGLFKELLDMIMANALIAFPVLFAVLAGAVWMVLAILRKFGVSGKR